MKKVIKVLCQTKCWLLCDITRTYIKWAYDVFFGRHVLTRSWSLEKKEPVVLTSNHILFGLSKFCVNPIK
jgi:hypothetical protein